MTLNDTAQEAQVSCDLIVEGRLVKVSLNELFVASGADEKLAWIRFYQKLLKEIST